MHKLPKPLSPGEEELARHLRTYNVPFEREFQFDPERKWRADFLIEPNILVEVEGGAYSSGRHTRGKGFEADCLKYNRATTLEFKLYRFSTFQVSSGVAIDTILEAIRRNHLSPTQKGRV